MGVFQVWGGLSLWTLNSLFLSPPKLTSQSMTLFLNIKSVCQAVKVFFFLRKLGSGHFRRQCSVLLWEMKSRERRDSRRTHTSRCNQKQDKEMRICTLAFRSFFVKAFAFLILFCLSLTLYLWKVLFSASSNSLETVFALVLKSRLIDSIPVLCMYEMVLERAWKSDWARSKAE